MSTKPKYNIFSNDSNTRLKPGVETWCGYKVTRNKNGNLRANCQAVTKGVVDIYGNILVKQDKKTSHERLKPGVKTWCGYKVTRNENGNLRANCQAVTKGVVDIYGNILVKQDKKTYHKTPSRKTPSRKTPSRKTPSRKTPSRKTRYRKRSRDITLDSLGPVLAKMKISSPADELGNTFSKMTISCPIDELRNTFSKMSISCKN